MTAQCRPRPVPRCPERTAGLHGRAAAALVASAFLVVMAGTTLPTPLYPLYQDELHFGPATSTVVFAVYAAGVAVALVLLGRLSDQIGRRAVLLPGIALAALSDIAFLPPHGLPWLLAGRALSGLSAGISPQRRRRCWPTWRRQPGPDATVCSRWRRT